MPVTKVLDIKQTQLFPPCNVLSTSFPTNFISFATFFLVGGNGMRPKKVVLQKNDAKFSRCFFGTPGVVIEIPASVRAWASEVKGVLLVDTRSIAIFRLVPLIGGIGDI